MGVVFLTHLRELLDEAHTALRVGVASVHEAVYESLRQPVLLSYFHELEQVVERRVYAAVRCKSHEVKALAVLLGVAVCSLDARVFHDRAVLAGTVDFHKVLIYHSTCSDVEVSHFRVTHLSIGQTHVFA